MPRAPNVVFAIVAAAACGREAVGPPPTTAATDAALVAAPVATNAVQVVAPSKTAGLDDVLARVVPTLGASGLKDPLTRLRDDLVLSKSTVRSKLLSAAYTALDRFQSTASNAQQADAAAIRLVLDTVRLDNNDTQ